MKKLTERECTLGSIFFKLNEVIEKINNIPTVSKIEMPKVENPVVDEIKSLNESIVKLNGELITLKQNVNKALNDLVNSVNDNFEAIDKRINNLGIKND